MGFIPRLQCVAWEWDQHTCGKYLCSWINLWFWVLGIRDVGICMAPTDIAASLKVHTTCKLGIQIRSGPSLGPRPTLFWFSVCVHSNAWEWKTGEKRGRPGSIHHVSGLKVDVEGGGGGYSNIYVLKTWKRVSYHSRQIVSITLKSGVKKSGKALERMVMCIVFGSWAPPPLRPPRVHLTSRDECS